MIFLNCRGCPVCTSLKLHLLSVHATIQHWNSPTHSVLAYIFYLNFPFVEEKIFLAICQKSVRKNMDQLNYVNERDWFSKTGLLRYSNLRTFLSSRLINKLVITHRFITILEFQFTSITCCYVGNTLSKQTFRLSRTTFPCIKFH